MKNQFYLKQLNQLVGGKIINLISDQEEEFFGIVVRKEDGEMVKVWFLKDDEGNGPGSFEIQ